LLEKVVTACLLLFIGVVLTELPAKMPLNNDSDCERNLAVTHKFRDFTYWNLDLPPSANDKIMQVMKWIDIAKAVHFCELILLLEVYK